jgi:nucleoside-diphosphate-sugar epimerase
MNILVTGCAGYIGSILCPTLLHYGFRLIGVDNFRYNNQLSVHNIMEDDMFSLHNIDVRNLTLLSPLLKKADIIIPLAGIVGAPACDKYKRDAIEINDEAIHSMVSLISKQQKIIFPNTNSGYGIAGSKHCTEESPLNPISLYGITKCNAEKYILNRNASDVVFRLATVSGSSLRMRFDLLVNDFVSRVFYDNKISIFQPYYRRNFVSVLDVARAFAFTTINNYDINGVYNIGHPLANITKLSLAEKVVELVNPSATIKIIEGNDQDKRDYVVSNEKILKTGFKFVHPIETSIKSVVDYCKITSKEDISKMRNI